MPLEVFYSYSHEDEKLRDKLEKQLTLLRRNGLIVSWHDRRIGAGQEWSDQIDAHVRSAHIILLLISADFIASDYCYGVEMEIALERQRKQEAIVIPVILRPVDWSGAPFARLQALPRDGKPVTKWDNEDEAFADVARGIREVVERFQRSAQGAPGVNPPLVDTFVPKPRVVDAAIPSQSEMNLVQMHLPVSADSPGGRAGPVKPSPPVGMKTEGGKPARKKAEAQQSDTSGWNEIKPYAIISLISFLLGTLLVFFMVWKAEKLVALGLTGKLYYIVLLPLGLSVAGFLFGVVQSYATFKGKQVGGNLVLGGPIVGFFLVVILGFVLVPDPSTFPVTVFVHGPSGPQDTVLQNSGEVLMDLGGDRQKAAIGEQGQAYFRAIPANFRGQEVLAWVSSDKFESAEANKKYKLDGQAIYLVVRRKAGRLSGLVESDDPKCLVGVQLRVAGLAIPVNPDSSRFDVSIPGDHLEDELVLDVTGPGCTPQHINVVPNSNDIRITLHRPPAGSAKE